MSEDMTERQFRDTETGLSNVFDFESLRALTPARLELRRAGPAPSTAERLRFAADHSLARDAVRRPLDARSLLVVLETIGIEAVEVRSRACSSSDHLLRPDLGRRLDPKDLVRLAGPTETAWVIADGLSSGAVERYAPRLLSAVGGVGRAVVVHHGRVAIGDEIGAALGASLSIVLIGERPGLSAAESMGVYVTYGPAVGCTDAQRNCISNIRDGGLAPEAAAELLSEMVARARREQRTGV
ncbi:ethanolamine ammonia-lyase subunit EutC, partial [Fimbriimonas ginsengisoli]|uniref:Ethanolamine ammonia-lyase small subunit n=1 Tax=Fimbriimonas ginsengisoli Gsoil 348 TaxID=661478 RepID=A0A068NUZ1_FIMGI